MELCVTGNLVVNGTTYLKNNVDIGTIPSTNALIVNGAIKLFDSPSNPGKTISASFWNQAGTGPTISRNAISFQTNGTTEAIRTNFSGNVGIGTTNSSGSKLELYGNLSLTTNGYIKLFVFWWDIFKRFKDFGMGLWKYNISKNILSLGLTTNSTTRKKTVCCVRTQFKAFQWERKKFQLDCGVLLSRIFNYFSVVNFIRDCKNPYQYKNLSAFPWEEKKLKWIVVCCPSCPRAHIYHTHPFIVHTTEEACARRMDDAVQFGLILICLVLSYLFCALMITARDFPKADSYSYSGQ